MNETRGNARTKPINFDNPITIEDYRQILKYYYTLPENMREPLKEREINSLKDSEKTNKGYCKGIKKEKFNPYEPILDLLEWSKPPKIIYYELRIWKNHKIITMNVYTTLKEALNYYKKKHLNKVEENNQCYVEIVKIDNLNPRYK